MRILVTGSRYGWNHIELSVALRATVDELAYMGAFTWESDDLPVLVHGGARGVDTQAAQIWADMGLPTEAHHAKWHEMGRRAGPVRNQEMVDAGANLCLAFLDPDSKGTADCVARAEKAGILVRKWTR